ncbi:MAG TPA: hypothetical protein VEA38_04090 [Terriglobales bacterium]|nr:hypothetical protein [Terriglobales bacterium]
MNAQDRKPPASAPPRPVESKEPQAVRYKPTELDRFREHAQAAGMAFTTYMREATLMGDRVLHAQVLAGEHIRATA